MVARVMLETRALRVHQAAQALRVLLDSPDLQETQAVSEVVEYKVPLGKLASQEIPVLWVLRVRQVQLGRLVNRAHRVNRVREVSRVQLVSLVLMVVQGPKDRRVSQANRATEDKLDLLVHLVNEAHKVRLASRASPARMGH